MTAIRHAQGTAGDDKNAFNLRSWIKVTKDVMGSKDVLDAVLHWDMEKLRTPRGDEQEAFHAAVKAIAERAGLHTGTRSSRLFRVHGLLPQSAV